MTSNVVPFLGLALSIGFFHTLFGPDHYLPFIVLSRARKWSLQKTLWITFGCGLGHVLSSVVLGFLGIGFGWAVGELVEIESQRGSLAGWLLLSLGIIYCIWGVKQGLLNPHSSHSHHHHHHHHHHHNNNHNHNHNHRHTDHLELAQTSGSREEPQLESTTPWMLFLIFVFGPCEPLIPVLMYPAVQKDFWTLIAVVATFSLVTIATMIAVVAFGFKGLDLVRLRFLQRWTHAMAGGAISFVAAGMVFWGW